MGKEDALIGRTGRFKPENEQRSENIKQLEKSHRGVLLFFTITSGAVELSEELISG